MFCGPLVHWQHTGKAKRRIGIFKVILFSTAMDGVDVKNRPLGVQCLIILLVDQVASVYALSSYLKNIFLVKM